MLGGVALLAGAGFAAWRLHAGGPAAGGGKGWARGGGDGSTGAGSSAGATPNSAYHPVFTGQTYTPGLVSEPSLSKALRSPKNLVVKVRGEVE